MAVGPPGVIVAVAEPGVLVATGVPVVRGVPVAIDVPVATAVLVLVGVPVCAGVAEPGGMVGLGVRHGSLYRSIRVSLGRPLRVPTAQTSFAVTAATASNTPPPWLGSGLGTML